MLDPCPVDGKDNVSGFNPAVAAGPAVGDEDMSAPRWSWHAKRLGELGSHGIETCADIGALEEVPAPPWRLRRQPHHV